MLLAMIVVLVLVAVFFGYLTWYCWRDFDRFDKVAWPFMVMMIWTAAAFALERFIRLM